MHFVVYVIEISHTKCSLFYSCSSLFTNLSSIGIFVYILGITIDNKLNWLLLSTHSHDPC